MSSRKLYTNIQGDMGLFIIVIVMALVLLLTGFVFVRNGIAIHDAPLEQAQNRLNKVEYILHINSSTTGEQKVAIATAICTKQWEVGSEFRARLDSPSWMIRDDAIQMCVDSLIKG